MFVTYYIFKIDLFRITPLGDIIGSYDDVFLFLASTPLAVFVLSLFFLFVGKRIYYFWLGWGVAYFAALVFVTLRHNPRGGWIDLGLVEFGMTLYAYVFGSIVLLIIAATSHFVRRWRERKFNIK